MVGIVLSPEQVKTAPPEVRQWLEQQLGLSMESEGQSLSIRESGLHLMTLTDHEAAAILARIARSPQAVDVFFLFSRAEAEIDQVGVVAFPLEDMMRSMKLDHPAGLLHALRLINEAASALRSDLDGRMCLIDRRGHCLITSETQRSIRTLWQKVFARHDSTYAPIPQAIPLTNGAPTEPLFHLAGRIPQADLHLGGIEPPALRAAPQMGVHEINGADDRPL